MFIIGLIFLLAGFVGAFATETLWWQARYGRRWPLMLRLVFFLLLVRGVMRLSGEWIWMALGIVTAVAAGVVLLWLDRYFYYRRTADGRRQ